MTGIKIPDYMQGHAFAGPAKGSPNEFVYCTRDRMDERYDMIRSVMDSRWLYIHNYQPDLPYVQPFSYMFQARGYQSWAREAREGRLTPATAMFWGEKPTEELYDMLADPDSVHNLVQSKVHNKTFERMRAALKKRVLANRDNGFLPEGSDLEGYEASRVPGAFPVERAFDLANLASERSVIYLPNFIEALGDLCEPVRWWAAQGCTMLRDKAAPAEAALRLRLTDKSGAVQIAAAEALAHLGRTSASLPVLERWLRQEDNVPFALQAGNVLDRLGDSGRPALPTVKAALARAREANRTGEPSAVRIFEYLIDRYEGRIQPLAYPVVPVPKYPLSKPESQNL